MIVRLASHKKSGFDLASQGVGLRMGQSGEVIDRARPSDLPVRRGLLYAKAQHMELWVRRRCCAEESTPSGGTRPSCFCMSRR